MSKAVAIFLVLVGHVVQYSGKSGPDNCLWAFIYSFHMPLFMFMSGMFAVKSMNLTTGRFVYKKFVQLLLPVASWSVFAVLLFHGGISTYLDLVSLSGMYLWFLKILFLCYLLMFILNRISMFMRSHRISLFPICFFIILVLLLLPVKDYFYWNLCFMFPFFLCGSLFNKYRSVLFAHQYKSFLFSVLVFVVLLVWWDYRYTIYFSNAPFVSINPFCFDVRALTVYAYRFFTGLSGALAVIFLCKIVYGRFKDSSVMPFLLGIGNCTLGIYVVQTFVVEQFLIRMKLNLSDLQTYIYSFFIAFTGLVVCWTVVSFLDKFRLARLILLGKRI